MNTRADTLRELSRLCHDEDWGRRTRPALPSGFSALDAQLPGGGWPVGALIELMSDIAGIGELQLLLPSLGRLARDGRHLVWIAPPYQPYAPALWQQGIPLERIWIIEAPRPEQALWAFEQALRCPAVGAVLGWPAHLVDKSVRRLQLAAEEGGSLGILYRPSSAAAIPSPAALRLRLRAAPTGLAVELCKVRGGRAGRHVHLHEARSNDALAVSAPAALSA